MPFFGTNQQPSHKISIITLAEQCPKLKSKMELMPAIINWRGMASKCKYYSYLDVTGKPKRKKEIIKKK